MKEEEVFQILHTINAAYSRFEVTDDRIILWNEMLIDMNFEKVMSRLKAHIREKPFPPTIAEITVHEPPRNEFLEEFEIWKREGAERIEQQQKNRKSEPRQLRTNESRSRYSRG
ncbi:replicative helicase loader/inhibitor [Heyndrickxia ginsengihumi]|uniref:replicative helicase loader/inhibitor n=1 Tax=Heyndrickxia ginsengihumi TaxID=363870 RepID=UPI000470FA17|nr:replicative helicase loader/inhibitor [Heyndrickxia ginsengihumi]